MKRLVRQILLLVALALPAAVAGEEIPAAPANHIYDPDFLISRELTTQMSATFQDFQTKYDLTIYLAVYTTPPSLIDETAVDLNRAWNQSGRGVVIVFAPTKRVSRVVPSPELSLVDNADRLTKIFQDASQTPLEAGDYSGATAKGATAVLKALQEVRARLLPPPEKRWWQLSRGWVLAILAVVLSFGLIFLRHSARIWRAENLFEQRYTLPEPNEPAALRFGAMRSGGRMATITFRERSKAKDV